MDIFTSKGLEQPPGDTQDDRRISNNSAKSHYSVSEFDECAEAFHLPDTISLLIKRERGKTAAK